MAPECRAFAPVAAADAELLLLGSMPGRVSLEAAEYYAHPRNAFWRIVGEIWGVPQDLPYRQRLEALRAAKVGLWDVLHRCRREGSLDQAIEADGLEANDFATWLPQFPRLRLIAFNGAAAERLWRRHVAPLPAPLAAIPTVRLPSSSPAHAALTPAAKLDRWRQALAVATTSRPSR